MCLTCGCHQPTESHGDPDNITLADMQRAASAAGIALKDALANVEDFYAHQSQVRLGLTLPDIACDIDGTLAFDVHAYLAVINDALGEHYSYNDVVTYHDYSWTSNPDKAAKVVKQFVHSDEFGWTIAPDYGAIAALRALYDAGFHIIINTLRNPRHEDATRYWLGQWQVPYHELRMGANSKQSVADEHDANNPVVFIDDCGDFQSLVKDGVQLMLLDRPYTESFGALGDGVTVVDTWQKILRTLGVVTLPEVQQLDVPIVTTSVLIRESATKKQIKAAGIAVLALDTGRILMIQRDFDDSKSKQAAGRWEFPGGKLNDGESPWDAAKREWEEETGITLPDGEIVDNTVSGPYQVFVYTIAHETDITLNPTGDDREVTDPDHPDAEQGEVCAWWRVKDARRSDDALREEFEDFDWDVIKDHIPDGVKKFNPNHDEHGRFAGGGGGGTSTAAPTNAFQMAIDQGGFTINQSGEPVTQGIAVAVRGHSLIVSDSVAPEEGEAQFTQWMQDNQELFASDPNMCVGGWYDTANAEVVFDPTQVFPDDQLPQAIQAGVQGNQQAVYNITTGEEIPTGGTGDRP